MMVVPVLMTSCQVSEKPKSGPVAAHTRTTTTASTNANGEPMPCEVALANRRNKPWIFTTDRAARIGSLVELGFERSRRIGSDRREGHRLVDGRLTRRLR